MIDLEDRIDCKRLLRIFWKLSCGAEGGEETKGGLQLRLLCLTQTVTTYKEDYNNDVNV